MPNKHHNFPVMSRQFPKFSCKQFPFLCRISVTRKMRKLPFKREIRDKKKKVRNKEKKHRQMDGWTNKRKKELN